MLNGSSSIFVYLFILTAFSVSKIAWGQPLELDFDPACYEDRLISETPIPDKSYIHLSSDGQSLVAITYDNQMLIYDIRNRTDVKLLSSTDMTQAWTAAIDHASGHAYIRVDNRKIQVYDISDPINPVLVRTGTFSSDLITMAASDGYLYTLDWSDRLSIFDSSRFDTSSFFQSRVTNRYYGPDFYSRISVHQSVLCMTSTGEDVLQILDVSNPSNPTLIEMLLPPNGAGVQGGFVGDGWIEMDHWYGRRLYEVRDDRSIGTIHDRESEDEALIQRVPNSPLVVGSNPDMNQYMHLDFTDVKHPRVVKRLDLTPSIRIRWSNEQIALLSTGADTMSLVDIRSDDDSNFTTLLKDRSSERFLGLEDGLAFVHLHSETPPYMTEIYDYRVVQQQPYVGMVETQSVPRFVLGSTQQTVFITDMGVDIYNSANPISFELLSTIPSGEIEFSSMQFYDDDVLVLNQGTEIHTFDISDPTHPNLLGSTEIGMSLDSIYFDKDTLVGINYPMIHTFHYAGPESVEHLATFQPQTSTNSIAIRDGFIYASRRLPESDTPPPGLAVGLEVIKIRDPRNPVSTVYPTNNYSVIGMETIGDELWVFSRYRDWDTDSYGRIYIYSLEDPSEPIEIRSFQLNPELPEFSTSDGHVVISNIGSRVVAMDMRHECLYCPADITGDGHLDLTDAQEFVTLFTTSDRYADYNFDGNLDYFDVAEFLNAYFSGCP